MSKEQKYFQCPECGSYFNVSIYGFSRCKLCDHLWQSETVEPTASYNNMHASPGHHNMQHPDTDVRTSPCTCGGGCSNFGGGFGFGKSLCGNHG